MIYLFYLIIFIIFIINDFFIYIVFNISIFQLVCNNLIILILDVIDSFFYLNKLDELIINTYYIIYNYIYLLPTDNEYINLIDNKEYTYILCYFDSYLNLDKNIYFYPMQSKIYFIENESILSFYKLNNNTINAYNCYAYYELFPYNIIPFFIKEQCFCMENFIIHANELLYLPIVFHILDMHVNTFLILTYILICT
jgi:hypothetical protein